MLSVLWASTIWDMVQLAIRCQPCVPVSADALQGWLELEVHELRADALRNMRLLGLQPTLLAPSDAGANGRAA